MSAHTKWLIAQKIKITHNNKMKRYKITWEYGPFPEEKEDDCIWYPGDFWGVPVISPKDENEFIKKTILDSLVPFREARDYTALGRDLIAIEPIPKGAPMWYDGDSVTFSAISATLGGDIHLYEEFGD